MSDPTRKPTTWQQVQAWSKKAMEEKLHFVLLLILAALVVSSTGNWFFGHVALASVVAVPTVKWFIGKHDRSPKRWKRIALGVVTLTALIWGGIADGFESGVLYACLIFLISGFGWVMREKALASLIFACFVLLSEWGNVACFIAALLVTAGMLHLKWKNDAANAKARQKDLFQDADLSQRTPHTHLGTAGGGFKGREGYGDQSFGPYAPVAQEPERREENRTVPPVSDRPVPRFPRPTPTWATDAEQGEHPGAAFGMTDPRQHRPVEPVAHPTGVHSVLPEGDLPTDTSGDLTGRRTTAFPVPERLVKPPILEGDDELPRD